jgi:SAM-dependent methyltransferase
MLQGPPVRLQEIAPNLERCPGGWWASPSVSNVSYPEEGNALCFAVEESSFWFEHRNRCILEAMRLFPPAGALFDVGGGNGCVALAIQQSGVPVVLVEPGFAGVRNAVHRGIHQVVWSTLEDAGVLPETLPAVGLFDVIEHIENAAEFLQAVHRLMTPGGRLYCTVPAYQFLWSDEDILAGHARRYNLPDIVELLRQCGFTPDFASYIFSFLPLPILLRRVIPYRLGLRSGALSEQAVRSDHEISSSAARRVLQSLTGWELSRLAARRPLPGGGSCLVVARKS